MLDLTKQVLQNLINLVQAYRNGEPSESIMYYADDIKKNFLELRSMNLIKDFYESIRNEFSSEVDIYILLLSVIYNYVKDEESLKEVMQLLYQDKIEFFTGLNVRTQIESCIFRNPNISRNYRLRRKIHMSQLLKLEEMLNLELPYRPLSKRNEKRIVIVTNQLLVDLHAPTNITKEISYILEKKLGFEVFLIVAGEGMGSVDIKDLWFEPIKINYVTEYTGDFLIERHGKQIAGYQIILSQNNLDELRRLVVDVYNYNPAYVWYMGGMTLFADLFRDCTTVLAMPFTDGFAISEAPIMVNYLNSQSNDVKDMESYLKETNQISVHYDYRIPVRSSDKRYARTDFALKNKDFVISIVGNRLDSEITDDFLLFLKKVLGIDPNIVIVFIGVYDHYNLLIEDKVFKDKTRYLGFQDDLLGILKMMDLFLNPPRQGGGTGAIYSLYNGVPVVTLDHCDVANFVSKEDVCANEIEMLERIEKYITDPVYYEMKSKDAENIRLQLSETNLTMSTNELFDEVKKIAVLRDSYSS